MGWRWFVVGSASAIGLFAALQQDNATRAYYSDAETFMGIIYAVPLLSGLLALALIAVYDFARSNAEKLAVVASFRKDPVAWTLSAAKITAQSLFLGCIFVGLFGQGWIIGTWFFGVVALVAAILTFFT